MLRTEPVAPVSKISVSPIFDLILCLQRNVSVPVDFFMKKIIINKFAEESSAFFVLNLIFIVKSYQKCINTLKM